MSIAPGGAGDSEGSNGDGGGDGDGEDGDDGAPIRPLADLGGATEGSYEGDRASGGSSEMFATSGAPAATSAAHTPAAHISAAPSAIASA